MTFSTSLAQLFCSSTSSIFEMYNMPGKLPYSHTHTHTHTIVYYYAKYANYNQNTTNQVNLVTQMFTI